MLTWIFYQVDCFKYNFSKTCEIHSRSGCRFVDLGMESRHTLGACSIRIINASTVDFVSLGKVGNVS